MCIRICMGGAGDVGEQPRVGFEQGEQRKNIYIGIERANDRWMYSLTTQPTVRKPEHACKYIYVYSDLQREMDAEEGREEMKEREEYPRQGM